MKNNNSLKNVFKIFLLGLIVISSIYALYFYNPNNPNNSNNNTLETFGNCSNCKLAANKCKPIYDINYNWDSQKNMVNINNIETDYVLCEWEPNCSYANTGANILAQEDRLRLSNAELQRAFI